MMHARNGRLQPTTLRNVLPQYNLHGLCTLPLHRSDLPPPRHVESRGSLLRLPSPPKRASTNKEGVRERTERHGE
jgi:hypothetical protein